MTQAYEEGRTAYQQGYTPDLIEMRSFLDHWIEELPDDTV